VSVEEVGAIWGTIGKVGAWEAKKVYHGAQNIGMRYQNWRHKGAGETDEDLAALNEQTRRAGAGMPGTRHTSGPQIKPYGKNWSTDEEELKNTTTSHTTYTRKRTR
jgi:hypothetical protein